ncbi:uncharacterized protein BJ171DRAFT_578865 [Polychytrium aggregatum]|uniref:uncharacterized protein n=1 Tax=Polychytrium aggregatum TaxID=110093 RepID=UPI0022FE4A25|nr:uncharacterized protein BJ171DRAFT_578865 [Polychytrium aggregatum]KAI9207126.1 hypothetical protein BJ171DRAFT_578865 [Polychytrium aggregatum]
MADSLVWKRDSSAPGLDGCAALEGTDQPPGSSSYQGPLGPSLCEYRGTEIIFYRHPHLWLVDVKTLKSPDQQVSNILDTSSIPFEPKRIVLSGGQGNLLALFDERRVYVIRIPPLAIRKSKPIVHCKSFQVASSALSALDGAHIVKVLWHPLAPETVLCILTSDGVLRLVDISRDPDVIDQQFAFASRSSRRSHGFGLLRDENDIVSFTFGPNFGWGPMTVYVLMKNGDLFSMCPVAPTIWKADAVSLLQLEELNEADYRLSSQALKPDTPDPAKDKRTHTESPENETHFWRNKFVADLNAQLESIISKELPLDQATLTIPRSMKSFKPKCIGPYLLKPSTQESFEDPCDILCLGSDQFATLVVGYMDKMIGVFSELESSQPFWNIEAVKEHRPCRTLYVSDLLYLGTEVKSDWMEPVNIKLYRDPQAPSSAFCVHSSGIYHLEVFARQTGSDTLEAAESSRVEFLLDAEALQSDRSTIVGFTPCNSSILHPCVFVLDDTGAGLLLPHTPSTPAPREPTANPSSNQEQSILLEGQFNVSEFDALNRDQLTNLLKLVKDARFPDGLSEDNLSTVARCVQILYKHIEKLLLSTAHLEERRLLQIEEYNRQRSVLADLETTVTQLVARDCQRDVERFDQIIETDKTQREKADAMLQILTDHTQPQLSEDEKKWFKQLKQLRRNLRGFKDDTDKIEKAMTRLSLETDDDAEPAVELGTKQRNLLHRLMDDSNQLLQRSQRTTAVLKNKLNRAE